MNTVRLIIVLLAKKAIDPDYSALTEEPEMSRKATIFTVIGIARITRY